MARVSLGYDKPSAKFKIENTSQVSKSVVGSIGLSGGKPTARLDLSANKMIGTMTGLTDEEVCYSNSHKDWCYFLLHSRLQSHGLCLLSMEQKIGRMKNLVIGHLPLTFIDLLHA